MKQLKVRTDIGGSHVVVFDGPDHYIDARKDVRTPGYSHIERVRGGQVQCHWTERNDDAPEKIVQLMREHMA